MTWRNATPGTGPQDKAITDRYSGKMTVTR